MTASTITQTMLSALHRFRRMARTQPSITAEQSWECGYSFGLALGKAAANNADHDLLAIARDYDDELESVGSRSSGLRFPNRVGAMKQTEKGYRGLIKTARIMWFATYAQRTRQFTAMDVLRELGISHRTFMRYVSVLREAGFTIDYEPDRGFWKYYCWDMDMAPVKGAGDSLSPERAGGTDAVPLMGML